MRKTQVNMHCKGCRRMFRHDENTKPTHRPRCARSAADERSASWEELMKGSPK